MTQHEGTAPRCVILTLSAAKGKNPSPCRGVLTALRNTPSPAAVSRHGSIDAAREGCCPDGPRLLPPGAADRLLNFRTGRPGRRAGDPAHAGGRLRVWADVGNRLRYGD